MKRVKLFSVAGGLLVFANACNDNTFQRGENKNKDEPVIEQPPGEPPELLEDKEIFDLTFQKAEIDMVWLIDNSGSMANEAAQVRNNFAKFIEKLSDETNLKLALISMAAGTTGVDLSALTTAPEHVQHNIPVNSNNALAIAASAVCPAQAANTDPTVIHLCGKDFPVNEDEWDDVGADGSINTASGKLTGFFRPNSSKIFIIVTDDNALVIDNNNFLEMIKPYAGESPYIYSFRGIANDAARACQIAERGTAYEELAIASKGEVYDICEPDWSAHFDKLTESVEKIGATTFTLKTGNIQIIAVKLDGTELAADQWELKDNVLTIKPDVFQAGQKNVEVIYKLKENL